MPKSPKPFNLYMPNTWVITKKTFFGLANSQTPTAHYATKTTKTHGPTYYQCVKHPYLKG